MAHEFEKINRNGVVSWKCRTCSVEFQGKNKPRYHLCTDGETPTRRVPSEDNLLLRPQTVNVGPNPRQARPPPGLAPVGAPGAPALPPNPDVMRTPNVGTVPNTQARFQGFYSAPMFHNINPTMSTAESPVHQPPNIPNNGWQHFQQQMQAQQVQQN